MSDPFMSWLPGSFTRRPEWRWLRAEYLHQTQRRIDRRIDDDDVIQARKVLAQRFGKQSRAALIHAASAVWTGDERKRGELEARLITDEPEAEIALRLQIPLPVVEAYHSVFFEVRTKKLATDWRMLQAIGYSPFRGFIGAMPFAAWKLAAEARGTAWLEQTIAATTAEPLPAVLPTDLSRSAFSALQSQCMVKLWIQILDAITSEKLKAFILDYRKYRKWVADMTGVPRTVSRSQLVCEEFLLQLPDEPNSCNSSSAEYSANGMSQSTRSNTRLPTRATDRNKTEIKRTSPSKPTGNQTQVA